MGAHSLRNWSIKSVLQVTLLTVTIAIAQTDAIFAQTATWTPQKTVELVVPGNPGDSVDRTLRLVHSIWQAEQPTRFTASVVNKPGGGQSVSWAYLAQHAGDGHYLAVTSPTLMIRRITGQSTTSHTKDVTPIALLFDEYITVMVRADSPIKTGRDLIERLKSDPRSLSIAVSPGLAGPPHLAIALALKAGGVDVSKLRNVVFDGSSKSVTAVLGGHVDVATLPVSVVASHLEAGTARILAVSSPQRLGGVFANVPTWSEQGFQAVFGNWRAIIAPADLPPAQTAFWDSKFSSLGRSPDWNRELVQNVWSTNYKNSVETRAFMDEQYEALRGVLTDLGMAK